MQQFWLRLIGEIYFDRDRIADVEVSIDSIECQSLQIFIYIYINERRYILSKCEFLSP